MHVGGLPRHAGVHFLLVKTYSGSSVSHRSIARVHYSGLISYAGGEKKGVHSCCSWLIVVNCSADIHYHTIECVLQLPDILQKVHKHKNISANYIHCSEKKNDWFSLASRYFCVSADPDGRLVRPEELVFIDAVEATLLGGVPGAKLQKRIIN